MRLCIVTHNVIRTDGQGRVTAEVVQHMAAEGAEIDLVAHVVGEDVQAVPGVRWHRVELPQRLPSHLLKGQWFGWRARQVLGRLPRPDVLQVNGAVVHGVGGDVNVANFVHADWLRSPHHPAAGRVGANAAYQYAYTRLNAAWERRAFARAGRVVAVSGSVRDALVRWAGVDPGRVSVIPNGVDVDLFRPQRLDEPHALREELGLGPDAFLLLFVGDIRSNRKNLDLVLRSLQQLPTEVRLAVVGDASRSPYPAMAAGLGVADRVHFLGHRSADVPALMRGADVFAFPSHYDPFGLVVTEAMASGLPVVTARSTGASSVITDGADGFVLSAATDLDGFVRVIRRLYADRALRAEIGSAARATAERHTWAAMAGRYEQLYRTVAARPLREPSLVA